MRDLRVAHVADTHLGYRSSTLPGRDEDFSRSWISACRAIVDSKPDIILHAGDIFHNPHPSWGAVASFLEGVYLLRTLNVPILMISGNHDSSRIALRHTVFSVIGEMIPEAVICHDTLPQIHQLAEADVVLLSHRALLNPTLKRNLTEIIEELDSTKNTIMVAHGGVGGQDESEELGSIAIPRLVFDHPWSYVALGHLHMAQPFGANGWYSGSIERCGWSDFPASPAWTLTTLSNGAVRHTQQPLPHLDHRQLATLPCVDVSLFQITDEILTMLEREKLTSQPTIVRVVLEGIPQRHLREVQRSTQRLVKTQYPQVVLQVTMKGGSKTSVIRKRDSNFERMQSVSEMFKEFVSLRSYEEAGFDKLLLDKGMEAIEKVQGAAHEMDTGDERSVPNG